MRKVELLITTVLAAAIVSLCVVVCLLRVPSPSLTFEPIKDSLDQMVVPAPSDEVVVAEASRIDAFPAFIASEDSTDRAALSLAARIADGANLSDVIKDTALRASLVSALGEIETESIESVIWNDASRRVRVSQGVTGYPAQRQPSESAKNAGGFWREVRQDRVRRIYDVLIANATRHD